MAEDNEQDEIESDEPPPQPQPAATAEQKSSSAVLIVVLLILVGGFGGTFMYLDGKVEISAKKLDRVWAEKQSDLRSMARQRMYNSRQSHLQTEMMDRWRNVGKTDPRSEPLSTKP
jgi:hypothetical protein